MAKGASPGTVKEPVAGQAGYEPFKHAQNPAPREMVDVSGSREMAFEKVQPKAKRQEPPISPAPARAATAIELLDALVASGTPPKNLLFARGAFMDRDREATAEECFRLLEAAEDHGHEPVNVGTIRKAGKWLWGSGWEPESAVLLAPADEIRRLRGEVANLDGQIAAANTTIGGLRHQIAYQGDKIKDLSSKVDWLRAGRPADELAAIGAAPASV